MGHLRKLAAVCTAALVVSVGSYAETAQGSVGQAPTASLETSDRADAAIVQPRYTYTNKITADLSFSNGKAVCKGRIEPRESHDVTITLTLYKKSGENWTYITSWHSSATGGLTASVSGSISVSRGTYKLVTSGDVGGLEFPTVSTERTY